MPKRTPSENKPYLKELLKNKTFKYGLIGIVILVLLYLSFGVNFSRGLVPPVF